MEKKFESHNSLSALGAFLPQEIIVKDAIVLASHNSLSALGAFLPQQGRLKTP